jgi:hypothetical protein
MGWNFGCKRDDYVSWQLVRVYNNFNAMMKIKIVHEKNSITL